MGEIGGEERETNTHALNGAVGYAGTPHAQHMPQSQPKQTNKLTDGRTDGRTEVEWGGRSAEGRHEECERKKK